MFSIFWYVLTIVTRTVLDPLADILWEVMVVVTVQKARLRLMSPRLTLDVEIITR